MPRVRSFFTALRNNEAANLPLGVAGYCWGGKPSVHLARGEILANGKLTVDAVFVAHRGDLDIPNEINKIAKPFAMAIRDSDIALNLEGVNKIKVVLEGKKKDVENQVVI
ncbi:MAG: hypothetical protein M1834_009180 [Cirrosporium novae-zelandiae]|nr:MAG: hypothetical protein M1834_009180 [Cirrosporium novae-zelandiae]